MVEWMNGLVCRDVNVKINTLTFNGKARISKNPSYFFSINVSKNIKIDFLLKQIYISIKDA